MERENNNTIIAVIITVLVMIILGFVAFFVYDKFLINGSNEPNIEENNSGVNQEQNNIESTNNNSNKEEINGNTPTPDSDNDIINNSYKISYDIGDKVILTDSSVWHVLESSASDNVFVTLLSSNNINSDYTITIQDAKNYLSTTYMNSLIVGLGCDSNDIKDIRLLSLEDVSKLSGINVKNLEPGKSLENGKAPQFLYENTTMTSDFYESNCDNCSVMVCEEDERNSGRICANTGTNTVEIRPIITISKKYIKK